MKISTEDWILLSVYLDGELSDAKVTRLEQRLETEKTLAAAYEQIKNTRTLLRRAPKIRAPRDFTLTSQMVGQQHADSFWSRFNLFRLASAAATLLLVAVLIYDFSSVLVPPQFEQLAAPASQEESLAVQVEESQRETMGGSEADEQEEQLDIMAESEEMPQEEPVESVETRETEAGEAEKAIDQGKVPPPESGKLLESDRPGEQPSVLSLPWLRIGEVVLAAGAIGFGFASWLVKRKHQ